MLMCKRVPARGTPGRVACRKWQPRWWRRASPHARARRRRSSSSTSSASECRGGRPPCGGRVYQEKRAKNEKLSVLIYLGLAPDGFESNVRASARAAGDGVKPGGCGLSCPSGTGPGKKLQGPGQPISVRIACKFFTSNCKNSGLPHLSHLSPPNGQFISLYDFL